MKELQLNFSKAVSIGRRIACVVEFCEVLVQILVVCFYSTVVIWKAVIGGWDYAISCSSFLCGRWMRWHRWWKCLWVYFFFLLSDKVSFTQENDLSKTSDVAVDLFSRKLGNPALLLTDSKRKNLENNIANSGGGCMVKQSIKRWQLVSEWAMWNYKGIK